MISRFTSNTDKLVPSKLICIGSLEDLNRKKMDEDMMSGGSGCGAGAGGRAARASRVWFWCGLPERYGRERDGCGDSKSDESDSSALEQYTQCAS